MQKTIRTMATAICGALGLFILAAANPAPAQAQLEICNQTGEQISVAVGYYDVDHYDSQGWWTIDDGACKRPFYADLKWRYFYLRAESTSSDTVWDGSYDFCVNKTAAFELQNADTSCDFDYEGFFKIDTGQTATDFTYTFSK